MDELDNFSAKNQANSKASNAIANVDVGTADPIIINGHVIVGREEEEKLIIEFLIEALLIEEGMTSPF